MLKLIHELRTALSLSVSPLCIKICKSEAELPQSAIRPYRDLGQHYAFCQAISLARTQEKVVAMTREDEWCWKPLIGFGAVQVDDTSPAMPIVLKNCGIPNEEAARAFMKHFPTLPYGSTYAIAIGPLSLMTDDADVVLIYCDQTAQLRWLAGAAKYMTGRPVQTEIDYIDSCVYSIVPSYLKKEFRVTIPDPGEMSRACCKETEIIFSAPFESFEELAAITIAKLSKQKQRLLDMNGNPRAEAKMVPDFPRPDFYNKLFKIWGLQTSTEFLWDESDR